MLIFALIFLGRSVQSKVALATTSNKGKLQCILVCIHVQITSVHSSQLCLCASGKETVIYRMTR